MAISLKTSNKFITLGWVKNPIVDNGDFLLPLAIEDYWGNVNTSDKSIMYKIYRENNDYRLMYNNSKSKLINKELGVILNDEKWHLLGWICQDDNGSMKYFIDDYVLPSEDGLDESGLEFSIAYSYYVRLGGGNVWSPYLYKGGQSIQVYNWRFGLNFILDDNWIRELNEIDREKMGI